MKVTVRLQAQLRQAAGHPVVALDVPPGSTVEAVVQTLAATLGDRIARLLLTPTGSVQSTLLLFRRDEQVRSTDAITADEELTILAPMAGG